MHLGLLDDPNLNAVISSKAVFSDLHGLVLLSHLGTFIIPSLLFFWIRKSTLIAEIGVRQFPDIRSVIVVTLTMIGSLYFVLYVYEWNKSLPLPTWATSLENDAEAKIKALISNTTAASFFINFVIMAILPAIGEEFIFRGILQNILISVSRKPLLAVIIASFVFSAIHLQFEGFIPRMILGFLLGYMYVITRNIWVPILGHLVNNAFQLILQYASTWMSSVVTNPEEINVTLIHAIPSLLLTIWLSHYLYVIYARKFKSTEYVNTQTTQDPSIS
jgi:uncharacterized protein